MKSFYLKYSLIFFGLIVFLATLSCAKSSTSPGPGPGPGPNTVSMADNSFNPSTITVTLSGGSVTVTWKNNGNLVHTATSDTGIFNTGDISPGQSKSITFTATGTYPYHCVHHAGMNGTVVVQ